VSRTFPLASTGARLSIHPSVDLKRAMARRIKLGNNIVIAKDAWLNVPGSLHGETGRRLSSTITAPSDTGGKSRRKTGSHLECDVILSPSTLAIDSRHGPQPTRLKTQRSRPRAKESRMAEPSESGRGAELGWGPRLCVEKGSL